MNLTDALNAALYALAQIDKLAEDYHDAEDQLDEIHAITGSTLGELARAGYTK